jgi:spore germination cell wall hydrolase CwlJ-like protein
LNISQGERKMYSHTKKAIILALILIITPQVSFAKKTKYQPQQELQQESEQICLAKAIYHEAKGEPMVGKKAVAKVVLNRKQHKKFPKSICTVVNQIDYIGKKKLCQFSWVCSRSKIDTKSGSWEDAKFLSQSILTHKILLPNFGPDVLFFKSVHSRQRFGKGYRLVSRLGNSNFYSKKIA